MSILHLWDALINGARDAIFPNEWVAIQVSIMLFSLVNFDHMFTGDAKIPGGMPYSPLNHTGVQMSICCIPLCALHVLAVSYTPI